MATNGLTGPLAAAIDRRNLFRLGEGAGLLGATALGVSACTSSDESATAPTAGTADGDSSSGQRVTFVVHDRNPFFAPVQAGFEAFAAAMGWQAQFTGPPQFDVQATVDMQSTAIQSGAAGLIFTRADDTAFDANILRAKDEGIPVLLSNVAGQGFEELGVGFVGQDFVPAGEVCGREAARYASELGRSDGIIVVGNFSPGNSALEQRAQGIAQGVEQYNSDNGTSFTSDVLVTSTDEAEAVGSIDAFYTREGDNVVGWAMTGFDHQFVATWARGRNVSGQFAIGGFDLVAPVLDGISAGDIDFSIGQNPYAQGWIAAALLAMEMNAGFPAFTYDTGAEIVDSTNIEAVVEREVRFED